MRIAVVGAGNMGAIYARIVAENPFLELAAIIGNSSERAERLGSQYGTRAYHDGKVAEALEHIQSLDAVIVATPEWVRLNPIQETLRAGKHLLYEKPLAATLPEAEELFQLLASTALDIITMPVFSLRFTPQFAAGRRKVLEGQIGEIRHISTRRNGNRTIAERIIHQISPFYWLSPHDMDLLRWFSGAEVEWVEAVERQVDDVLDGYILAHLHMSNGVDVQHMVSWCVPEISGLAPQSTFDVFGTEGMVQMNENMPLGAIYKNGNHAEALDVVYTPVVEDHLIGPFKNIVEHFVRCIRKGEAPNLTAEDALASVKICAAMERSARESRRVYLEELG